MAMQVVQFYWVHFQFQPLKFSIIASAEEEGEINYGTDITTDEENHQLKHREVFLSRQLEIINANTIR